MNRYPARILNYPIASVKVKTYLLLAMVCFVGYWPVSLNLFSLKNDATMYFLPYRYHISNAIQNGEFPFWSPYLYMGFPIHADMQSGAWNPIVWVISLFTRYNMSVLHFESLLYILIAGIGMYKLLQEFHFNEKVKTVIAISYMFCGFVTDSGEFIVWLATAAFIPFVLLYYYRLLYKPGYLNALKGGLALYLLLVAGYPSFLIYGGYILFAAFLLRSYGMLRTKDAVLIRQHFLKQLLLILVFTAFSLPAIISYLEFLPYYSRGTSISLSAAMIDPFCLKCSTSFLIPFNLSRQDIGFGTDITMRNGYVGIFSILFFLSAFRRKLAPLQRFVLAVTVFSFLFSLGNATPVREFCFRFLPLMDYFRHPANMRLFTSVGILFIAAAGLQALFDHPNRSVFNYTRAIVIGLSCIIVLIIVFYLNDGALPSGFKDLAGFNPEPGNWRGQLKDFIFNISFPVVILVIGIIQLAFLLLFSLAEKSKKKNLLLSSLIIGNILLMAQLSLPATFVSKLPPKNINRFISHYPTGFPAPDLHTSLLENAKEGKLINPRILGEVGFYNKKVEITESVLNPCVFNTLDKFLTSKKIKNILHNYPVVYFSDSIVHYRDTLHWNTPDPQKRYAFAADAHELHGNTSIQGNRIEVQDFNANSFRIKATANDPAWLNVFQNLYKHWRVSVDGKPAPIISANISFMSVMVPRGTHIVEFNYQPVILYIPIGISLAMFVIMAIFIISNKLKARNSNPAI